ncbi:MAG: hypothetical protein J0I26_14980 [Alphaproteobacteria bacterium]|jgi:hypothetical protein|nr:hypothetical protein [Alphaproteobacteria bacterium]MBN9558826.1 hypothetical protein [Alphaproteobacteria bacterium]MBN9566809.1 hypothetical protein [Alphaproteobacteria bacterium]MBN9569577.1 hypothetical protein [Alphaproteobacteria bacterium]MBN9576778.1 hypothetical protein [Alphaproteobacteria bacterium]
MKLYTRWQNSAGEQVGIPLHLKGVADEDEYVVVDPTPSLLPEYPVGRAWLEAQPDYPGAST